jgi:hypothetical protein
VPIKLGIAQVILLHSIGEGKKDNRKEYYIQALQ